MEHVPYGSRNRKRWTKKHLGSDGMVVAVLTCLHSESGYLDCETDDSKDNLQARDKEERKRTTTTEQTWTTWTRTTLKMKFQWVLWCFWSRGWEKKGGSFQ